MPFSSHLSVMFSVIWLQFSIHFTQWDEQIVCMWSKVRRSLYSSHVDSLKGVLTTESPVHWPPRPNINDSTYYRSLAYMPQAINDRNIYQAAWKSHLPGLTDSLILLSICLSYLVCFRSKRTHFPFRLSTHFNSPLQFLISIQLKSSTFPGPQGRSSYIVKFNM